MFDKITNFFKRGAYFIGETISATPQIICVGGGVILMIIGQRSKSTIKNPIEWIGLTLTATGGISLILYISGYSRRYKGLDVSDALATERITEIKRRGGYCTKYGTMDHYTICAPSSTSINSDTMNAQGTTKDNRLYDTRCYPKNFDTMDRGKLQEIQKNYKCSKQAVNYDIFISDDNTNQINPL